MARACVRCKLKKIKCDGLKPCCSRCCKLGFKSCDYPPDKRIDKRRVLKGRTSFVFKNYTEEKKGCRTQLPTPSILRVNSPKPTKNPSSNYENLGYILQPNDNDPLPMQLWSGVGEIGDLPCDFDIDQFFQYLDGSLSIEPSNFEGMSTELKHPYVYETYDEGEITKQELINAVFDNETHIPLSISRNMIEKIATKNTVSVDETFLLCTVQALGALALAKREFAQQRKKQQHPNKISGSQLKIPFVASEAYNYFLQARELLPIMVETPTKHGFRGLSLICNFMTMLLTIEAQMSISYYALQVATSIGIDSLTEANPYNEDYGLLIAFWEIWCCACMLSSFHGGPPPIRKEEIKATLDLNIDNEFASHFFFLRVQFADLHNQLARSSHSSHDLMSDGELRNAVIPLMQRMESLEEQYSSDEGMFRRHELLILELKCWKSQAIMLSTLSSLVEKASMRAVMEAKYIIRELWSYYNPDSFTEGTMLGHLDWNFTYPLRTATICAFTAVKILSIFIGSEDYLSYDHLEYQLGRKVLCTLTSMMPINKHLIVDLDSMNKF